MPSTGHPSACLQAAALTQPAMAGCASLPEITTALPLHPAQNSSSKGSSRDSDPCDSDARAANVIGPLSAGEMRGDVSTDAYESRTDRTLRGPEGVGRCGALAGKCRCATMVR
jgi:hypothetical protein